MPQDLSTLTSWIILATNKRNEERVKMIAKEYTIRKSTGGGLFEVSHWHTYPESSVLAGQQQEVIDGLYQTLEEAQGKYPTADLDLEGVRCSHKPTVPECPPSNFDHYDAGEYWHENDY